MPGRAKGPHDREVQVLVSKEAHECATSCAEAR
jgi:hypothetical protein